MKELTGEGRTCIPVGLTRPKMAYLTEQSVEERRKKSLAASNLQPSDLCTLVTPPLPCRFGFFLLSPCSYFWSSMQAFPLK